MCPNLGHATLYRGETRHFEEGGDGMFHIKLVKKKKKSISILHYNHMENNTA